MITKLILLTFSIMLISLFSGLYFLFKDKDKKNRLLTSLKLRVSLAIILIILISTGIVTNSLTSKAPWSYLNEVNENKQP